ncbi:neutral/alkaline non-lysosomal ceramidase N-terminal domain-containing protein [Paenibacillus solisilvae]|uniref:Neutral/alkaline non-lysosomal ceramidase N-terminal domain-containing protein n=1 Tax=Paenibacillus solisilvae TaxID=2486751 RepID=A0ABW0VQZ2_9BACL
MKLPLKLGTSKIDITPERPIPLAGFSSRKNAGGFDGVSRRLFARIFFFQRKNEQGKIQSALLVTADLIWWGSERVPLLKSKIREKWGVDESAIILHASHTHSGPQTSDRFTELLGQHDPSYIQYLENSLMDGIEQACRSLEPITMEKGIGECGIGGNRRNKQLMKPNPNGPRDHEVNVIRFLTETGATKAVLVHYACHPVVTRENLVSSEFTGAAMEYVEKSLGGSAISGYMQGCCGDINPVYNGEFCFGEAEEVNRLGRLLAEEVIGVLSRPMEGLVPCEISVQSKMIPLPLQPLPDLSCLEAKKALTDVYGQWSRMLLAHPDRMKSELYFQINRIQIADELALLGMNGEVVVEYGLYLKKQFQGTILPLPYSNGMIGYIPTELQLAEGGYESVDACYYFGMPAPFEKSVESIIKDALAALK